jgi:hypothetical protein
MQLDAKVMEQMRADLQGIMTDLYQYASLVPSNRKTNRYLLETSDTVTARLVPLSFLEKCGAGFVPRSVAD